jgi:DNA-binding winged helix-turn-helix (wHTH) protein/tetratricopeptide (TPR) repeat protein
MDRPLAWHVSGIDLAAERPFRLGTTSIDPSSRDATFPGGKERLRPQSVKVLIALVRRKGEVVSRNELVDLCWDGRVIGEDVINHSISRLRVFAERAGGFDIETVPKAGYRLIETGGHSRRRRWMMPSIGVAVILAIAAALFINKPWRQANPPTPRIAILAFEQAGPGAAELAAATRTALAHSLSEGGFPVRLAKGADGADLIISGDVRRMANRVRATVRVELSDPYAIIYSQQFDATGTDEPVLPERIGAQVGAILSWTGALMALDRRHPTDPAITAQLLKNSALSVQGGDPLQAYEISRHLVPRVPNSAIAQLGLAFETGFALEEIPRDQRPTAIAEARRAADRAMVLAPEFGDVYAPWCVLHSRTRFADCENRLRDGLRVDPDAPFIPAFIASLMDNVGRFDEALQLARMSLANDRYKPAKIARLLGALEVTGHTDEADELFQQATRWWPDERSLAINRMAGMAERGDFDAAERFGQRLGATATLPAGLSRAIKARDPAAARKACPPEINPSMASIFCMIGLAQAGDIDGAYGFADNLYPRLQGRSPAETEELWLDRPGKPPFSLLSAPVAAPMRRDPRFLELAQRTGLLGYWRSGRLPDFCRRASPEPVCVEIRRR